MYPAGARLSAILPLDEDERTAVHMGATRLSLRKARSTDRLQEFIQQQEADGIGSVDANEFEEALGRVIKPRRSEDQTSRSRARDGSSEK